MARRVERLRALRFKRVPTPERVTAAQARRAALRDFDRGYPSRRRAADEELLKLLGLLPARAGLRDIVGTLYREQVAGFYDPRDARLAVIAGATGSGPALTEMTLAHELTHALEDQRFPLLRRAGESSAGLDDAPLARLALTEGTATALMLEYADRHIPLGQTLGESLASSSELAGGTSLPRYVEAALRFPYLQGKPFVEDLYRRLAGWGLVDYALRRRPPVSTEQVLHPRKYLADERPRAVALDPGRVLGRDAGWRPLVAGALGEFDTRQLLFAHGAATPRAAAEGWGGARYELWRRGPLPDRSCPAPCRARDAFVARWRMDTRRDAHELAQGLRSIRGGTVVHRRDAVTLALAPTPELGRELAEA